MCFGNGNGGEPHDSTADYNAVRYLFCFMLAARKLSNDFSHLLGVLETLFAEEAGIIVEVTDEEVEDIKNILTSANVLAEDIGFVTNESGSDAKVFFFFK